MTGKPFNPMPDKKTDDLFNANFPAPEITGITNWLNVEKPLMLRELRGKVVLIDFWTYTCINCIRTLPHVTSWYEKYKDQGFVVLGVHTPEFEFEKQTENVATSVKQYSINYPVAQDNDYRTWDAFSNRYWPAKYLIDKDGYVRYYHFGEGEYEETEKAIRLLLEETGSKIKEDMSDLPDETPKDRNSPETYLGSNRMEYYFPRGRLDNGEYQNLTISRDLPLNSFTLGGNWIISNEYSEAGREAILEYKFQANKVFLVMRPRDKATVVRQVKVFLDGREVSESNAGADVKSAVVKVSSDRLYELINLKGARGEHLLRLEFNVPGIEVFAFTFG
jgi:thiol-disulfide isomerase/thioredoxin